MKALHYIFSVGLILLPLCLGAQTKGETKLYNKTVKAFSVKSADKFLKKYPKSVYAARVQEMNDSVLLSEFLEANPSRISPEEADKVAGNAISAIGWKKDGVEKVLALDEGLSLRVLTPEGELIDTRSIPVYTMAESPSALKLVCPLEVTTPFGEKRKYLHFAYRNGDAEYVEALYLPDEDLAYQAIFYGIPIGDGRIEGQSPEMMEGVHQTAELTWLAGKLRENPNLVVISKADLLTDESIRWWLSRNPKAETTASKLVFGRLDPESSIVEACKKAGKERGRSYSVALLDIRGYTVLCSVKGGEYSLIWCEPVCKNKRTDKYIRSYFFESDGTTLDVVYYKGKTTFKNKISLASQSIRHLK